MTETQYFALQGGLDLITPAIQTRGGRVIAGQNYEPHPRGYRRMDGHERFDGQSRPSEDSYWILRFNAGSTKVVEDDIVTGASSGATGRAVVDAQLDSGTYAGGDAAGRLVLMTLSGSFTDAESLEVASVAVATADGTESKRAAQTDSDDTTWYRSAVEKARADIAQVPGSGPVRGVWGYDGAVYAFRDNAGGSAGVMHKATSSGWSAVSLGRELAFTDGGKEHATGSVDLTGGTSGSVDDITVDGVSIMSGAEPFDTDLATTAQNVADNINAYTSTPGYTAAANSTVITITAADAGAAPNGFVVTSSATTITTADTDMSGGDDDDTAITDGDEITGATSGATATVTRVVLESGDWTTGDAAGRLIFASQTGTFQAEELDISGAPGRATIAGDSSAITLPAGGRYDFTNHNFFGSSDLRRMYGCNGQGRGFEFDGSVFVPIETGMDTDTPHRIAVHRNHLFLAFPGGSVQHSSLGNPYQWQVITGAGEIGLGEESTDLLGSVSGALSILGANQVAVLLGDDAENWELRTLSDSSGAVAWTTQKIGAPIYLDNSGLRTLDTTEKFGDFQLGTITQMVQPLFAAKRKAGASAIGSLRVRGKDQYRLFWDDGTGITVYFGREQPEILPFTVGFEITCTASVEDANAHERLYVGDTDGWVYEIDAGTSADGSKIDAFLRLPFNHVGTPAQNKRWQKAVVELDAGPNTNLGVVGEFAYADPNQPPSSEQSFDVYGQGGFWNEFRWDNFYWSAPVEGQAESDIDGIGQNVSLAIVSEATYEEPHILHGVLLFFAYRGLKR